MISGPGLSLYFNWDRIRFKTSLIEAIGNPEYIHLFIDSKNKYLYVQACERDKDAFKVYFLPSKSDDAFYIHAKRLLQYLSRLIGTDPSVSLRYAGIAVDETTYRIALMDYEEITRGQEEL